ncbi:defensin-like protein 1 [Cannabis sativa]|uniref:defensin-like protein 1 n=1 Tax=Cannabis sativa TaxID=3483 RepID=UPI0029CA1C03|nr:defensin-like protein 1 [Cannabis sativa]
MDRKGSFGFGSRVVFFWLFLVFILLASFSKMGSVEGRMCESQSHHYEGACVIDHNCATVCRTEGFSGGKCKGFRRRCFCTRQC